MTEYVDPRFRPTLWPGSTIPVPPLTRRIKNVRVKGDWILWTPAPFEDRTSVELPEDFYLRELMELPADDLEGAARMMAAYGPLFGADRDDLSFDDEDVYYAVQDIPEADSEQQPYPFGVHRDLVAIYVRTAQDAITTWLACQREGGLEELVRSHVTEETLADLRSQSQHREQPWPQSLEELQEILIDSELTSLQEVLNRALGLFSIGIGDLSDRYPTVYSVAFLQLYNHLVEGATVHHCANEPCGRAFVRQRGRAEYGQHRTTGVKYCSRECARAQAQRELRRRRKQEPTSS
ncbi:hypothetical protein AB0D27_25395 [Streptomyces sp. NPDC048415]|uniref:hypothetical protein n=1 Tax=Streptomyces sp. NPDC048415 TaxID=3154822 RepID=UPI003424AD44